MLQGQRCGWQWGGKGREPRDGWEQGAAQTHGCRRLVCTHRQLEGFVQEAVALAVQVGVGAARFGHSNPREPGFL